MSRIKAKLFTIFFNFFKRVYRLQVKISAQFNRWDEKLLARYYSFSTNKKVLLENAYLKNIHSGKRCFILGNGPSIRQRNLALLQNEFSFVVNSFYESKDFEKIDPKFYMMIDPDLFNVHEEGVMKWWRELATKAQKTSTLVFLPYYWKNTEMEEIMKGVNVRYIDYRLPFNIYNISNFDLTRTVNATQNVVIFCILTAIYMGFTEIYLDGVEHSWLSHYGEERHFYDSSKSPLAQTHAVSWLKMPYIWWLQTVGETFREYGVVKAFADKKNIKIINLTTQSCLDVFPFMDFSEVVKKSINN